MCGMHWQRWRKHGDPRVVLGRWKQTPEERFWGYVDKSGDCWLWTGRTKLGYGQFSVWSAEEGKDRTVQAHRFAYAAVVGEIPPGMTLDHLCHTVAVATCLDAPACPHRACVRPDHLEPVPLRENIQRGGNGAKTHCKRGHEFTPENTWTDKNGGRFCRACQRIHGARLRERRRAQRLAG
jgi:hypothetical protein